jgi:hypothetical protein
VFLELAKFASLLLSILSLDALFHTAFLEPGSHLDQRLLPSLGMLLLAAAVCLASGFVFRAWERKAEQKMAGRSISASLPMLIFWWGAGAISLLFAVAWLIERYYLGLWR